MRHSNTALKIIRLMNIIDEILILQSQVLKFQPPVKRAMRTFFQWLDCKCPSLRHGNEVFAKHNKADIIALRPAEGDDPFSHFLRDNFGRVLRVRLQYPYIVNG